MSQQVLSTLYSDPSTISDISRTLAYSEPCLFRHIEAYYGILYNNSYNDIKFLFFTLNFMATFQRNLKRHIF